MSFLYADLLKTFDPGAVSWRIGSTNRDKTRAMALAYIDARDVMERLDEVVGPGNWQCRYPHANGKTVCEIGLRINDEWVWKADGAGDSQIEAEKGALSDAFKRAAVRWGIGRYLYHLESPWVRIENGHIAPEELPKLRALLEKRQEPTEAPPHDDLATRALMDSGRAAATNGTQTLITWWMKLPKDTRKEFAAFKDRELKPMARRSDTSGQLVPYQSPLAAG